MPPESPAHLYRHPQVWDGLTMGPPRALKFAILEGRTLYDAIVAAASS